GVTVHAAATESLVRGETIHELPPIAGGALAALAVVILLVSRARRTTTALLLVSTSLIGFALLESTGIAIPFVALALTIVITEAALELNSAAQMEQRVSAWWAERRAQDIESKRVLAHELKTPLASMRGLSQLLGGFELSEAERRRVASLLESEAGKMQTLVSALLDLEKLPLRDFNATSTVTDPGDLVTPRGEVLRAQGH